jgi:hypothetical protein
MTLSILILHKQENLVKLNQLLAILLPQIKGLDDDLEIYIEGERMMQEGDKCNSLIKDAIGKYVWLLRDTDIISDTSVSDLLKAFESDKDIYLISGMETFNELNPKDFKECLLLQSPMKRTFAPKFKKKSVKAIGLSLGSISSNGVGIIENNILHIRNGLQVIK